MSDSKPVLVPGASPPPDLSFVIPVVERHGDLRKLFAELRDEVARLGRSAEFLFVIDHRQRQTIPLLRELQQEAREQVVLLLLRGSFGESAALTIGLKHARAGLIVTLASYFQVEPRGLGAALARIEEEGVDLVVGRRHPRTDSAFNRLQSRIFHRIVGALTGTRFGDISCGFRVLRRPVARELELYGGLHRFFPILAEKVGFRVEEIALPQRAEDQPTRYYGLAVYVKRMLDILTVFFLMNFTRRPLRFFGLVGLLLSVPGVLITLYLAAYRLLGLGAIANRPLLLLGVLMIVLGIQTLSLGLIGEIIIFTHARRLREYRIGEILQGRPEGEETATEEPEPARRAS